ncbi:MAG: pyrroline-5-carboxylate reductase [Pseudomonadales bacterium]
MTEKNITFIGAGNMASALIGGLVKQGWSASQFTVADPYQPGLERLVKDYGVKVASDNAAAASNADVVVLAVKPQVMREAIEQCKQALNTQQPLIISIAAGITIEKLSLWAGADLAIVRCMPNTPALVQQAATALYANPKVTTQQQELAQSILNAVGISCWVDEEALLDAVTAVSGSGPAYFFLVMEAMQNSAAAMGMPAEMARQLVQQTALGAAHMAQQSAVDVAELRRRVTSPGGTTEQALAVLQDGQLEALFDRALRAAQKRSVELANGNE